MAFTRYGDRHEAGRMLAGLLTNYANQHDVLVLGLARGGVPVAFEVARQLNCEMDVFVVRKLGTPGQEEVAMGAIAPGGIRLLNRALIEGYGISEAEVEETTRREQKELDRREKLYRADRLPLNVAGRTVIIVDDGLATGMTMRAALQALRAQLPKRLIIAVPVGAKDTCEEFESEVDQLFCPLKPSDLVAISCWYTNFPQTTDAEVQQLLQPAPSR